MDPMHAPQLPGTPDPQDARAPRALALLGLLVGLQAVALIVYGVAQTVLAFSGAGRMPWGSVLLMALLFFGYGAWLLGAVRALYRRRLWPRALVLLTQVFMVVLTVQMLGSWGWAVLVAVVVALLVLLCLFSTPVQKWLLASPAVPGETTAP